MISSADLFYHIYPLGMCGAPQGNDFSSPAGDGLKRIIDRIPHLISLGVSAVYIGPLFESTSHGYDTVDYWHVDRRLGNNEDLANLVRAFHAQGIKVVLDAVLNHTGRDFFAFRDLKEKGPASPYRYWYRNVDFGKRSPEGDQFSYEGWAGHFSLAKLDTSNQEVRDHLFGAIRHWIEDFGIDGLRLDAADVLEPGFMDALCSFCRGVKPDFWLMGEVVHGDYRNWARSGRLDAVTNYELYKGLWSSFNDHNFFEIAWSLNRQSGHDGMYRDLELYNFSENHDVNRVASLLKSGEHLFPLYGLLFTVPGVPSLYYGGEWGTRGEKKQGSDAELRPAIRETAEHGTLSGLSESCKPKIDSRLLEKLIRNLADFRKAHSALAKGGYRQVFVSNDQFAFTRKDGTEELVIAVNASANPANIVLADLPRERTMKEVFTIGTPPAPGGAAYRCGPHGFGIPIPANGLVIYALC